MMLIAIALACGLGALCRLAVSPLNDRFSLPYGTLLANYLTCFIMGLVSDWLLSSQLSLVLGTGFLGGLGTYSTLSVELADLKSKPLTCLVYGLASYGGGLICLYLGRLV